MKYDARLTWLLGLLVFAVPSHATWSIVLVDSASGEVAVGTVTCLDQFDLLAIVPVVVVGEGGGVVQAAGDFGGVRRPVIFGGFMLQKPPSILLETLSLLGGHEDRQYGIVDTEDQITFTGAQNGAWAGGVAGVEGTMRYAIQGNVLAGACVIDAVVEAVLNTPGAFPERLMAGMQAARATGGDGRCSCQTANPTECGCPPPEFTKSGHIGGLVVARIGDTDDDECSASGCVDGDYYMRLNVAFQNALDPDPVDQLQTQFDLWRADLVGRPDAVNTTVTFDPAVPPPNGAATTTMHIDVRDWQGTPIVGPAPAVVLEHAVGSDGLATIGPVVAGRTPGTYEVELTTGVEVGLDTFVVRILDGIRPVVVMPAPTLEYFALGDTDGSGVIDFADLLAVLSRWGDCPGPAACPLDLDADGAVGGGDVEIVLANWG